MVREIVFHLGDCKTGTTSVQSVLAAGAWHSAAAQICYPARFNHIPLAKTLSVDSEKPFRDKRFQALRKDFDSSDADIGVVSAEHFEFVDPKALKAAIEEHLPAYAGRIRLVAYVRPHADRLVSTFAERSKKGLFQKPLAAMHKKLAEDGLLFYTPRFQAWRASFGEAFTLRPFLRDALYRGDVVQDFFRFALSGADFTLTQPSQQNESLSVADVAMMRRLHNRIRHLGGGGKPLRQAQQALGWYLSDILAALPAVEGAEKPRLHRSLAHQVVETYKADAALLDEQFFDGQPLMQQALAAAPEKAVEAPQSFRAVDHFSAAELRQIEAWAQLITRMILADGDHFMWAVRPEAQRGPKPGRG